MIEPAGAALAFAHGPGGAVIATTTSGWAAAAWQARPVLFRNETGIGCRLSAA